MAQACVDDFDWFLLVTVGPYRGSLTCFAQSFLSFAGASAARPPLRRLRPAKSKKLQKYEVLSHLQLSRFRLPR